MTKEFDDRLSGLEDIVHGLQHNLKLLEYMSYDLHKATFTLSNNVGLLWIWATIMAVSVIDLYKLLSDQERHSFAKIINILKHSATDIDCTTLERKLADLKKEYDAKGFGVVRSKHIAHQDLNVPTMYTDVDSIASVTNGAIELYRGLFEEIERKTNEFSGAALTAFKEIFDTVEEYEKVKAFLCAAEIRGHTTIDIRELGEFIKGEN